MVKRLSVLALIALALAGCQTSVATYRTYPVYGQPAVIYDGPPMVVRRPLIVPHRDWIEQHCYPQRELLPDGRWIMHQYAHRGDQWPGA